MIDNAGNSWVSLAFRTNRVPEVALQDENKQFFTISPITVEKVLI